MLQWTKSSARLKLCLVPVVHLFTFFFIMRRVCLLFLGLLFLLIGGITHAIECPAGYEVFGPENNCRDIDECTESLSLCGNNSVCNNTDGSYFCRCEEGFISSKKEVKEFNATHRVKFTELNECLNGTDLCGANAECNNTEGSYFCTCKEGFTPSNGKDIFKANQQVKCEVSEIMCTVADIVMLIDGSWSIGRENFQIIRKFLEKVVNAFDVGIDKVRIGLVQYSGDPKAHWHLSSYTTKDEVITAIRNLPYKGGNGMTGRALTFIQENSFRLESGSRENVSKIAILVTDGKSQDDIVVPAQSLRDAGVELFAIGVKNADETELKLIASKPDETHVYNFPDFSFLFDILDGLTSNVCDAIKRQEEEIRMSEIMCTVADIVMLIDGSWSIGRVNFQTIRKFLENVVNAFDVGIDKVRIGLVQYSGDPKIEWHLNSYRTKDEVINAVRNLPYKGGNTMTGLALTFIQENSFRLQSGSRGNVSKIGILVTDGKSQNDIVIPAQSLRDAGVELFAIGVKNANETELKLIASKPDETHVYNVPDYSFLFDILDGLTSNVCDAIKRQEEEIRRVKNADKELKVITSKPDETHVYNVTDFSTTNTVTEGLTRNVSDAVKQQEEKIRPLDQMRIFCLKTDAEEP